MRGGEEALSGAYWTDVDRSLVSTAALMDLVASELAGQEEVAPDRRIHAALLDLDLPCELTVSPGGQFVLWVGGLDDAQAAWAHQVMVERRLGLPIEAVSCDRLQAAFSTGWDRLGVRERDRVRTGPGWARVDPWGPSQLMGALAPTWPRSWAQLVDATMGALVSSEDRGVPEAEASGPGSLGWVTPLPLAGPALLLPSAKNWHLHLDVTAEFTVWAETLEALSVTGLVEHGFAAATWMRGRSYLRVPWKTKGARMRLEAGRDHDAARLVVEPSTAA